MGNIQSVFRPQCELKRRRTVYIVYNDVPEEVCSIGMSDRTEAHPSAS